MSQAQWYALASVSGLGSVMANNLLNRFGSIKAIYQATDEQLLRIPRFSPPMLIALRGLNLNKFQNELDTLAQQGIHVWTWEDPQYPPPLRALNDAPILLFTLGTDLPTDNNAVAVVGTRSASKTGLAIATTISRELAKRSVPIVSGIEQGINAAAHLGALEIPNARSIAVIGSGLRPVQSQALVRRIAQHGVVLSEFTPDFQLRAINLKARDRLFNSLSRAVIVVEANLNSAALSTAQRAREAGNLVYAVSGSEGTEQLLRDGAKQLDFGEINYDNLAREISNHTANPNANDTPQQATLF